MSSTTRNSKRKASVGNQTTAKKQPWHKTDPPKYVSIDLLANDMHAMHKELSGKMLAMLEKWNASYCVAPAGSGKTTSLAAMFGQCTEDETVLNIVALPNATLVDDMKMHIPTSVPPPISPFGDTAKETALHKLLDDAAPGQTVAIMVTHDFVHKKLSPNAKYPYSDLKLFLRDVGKPKVVRLFIDEGHNLCSNAKWGELLSELRAQQEGKTRVQLVLFSATAKLGKKPIVMKTATLLGVEPEVLMAEVVVSPTAEQVSQFKLETSLLPLPDPGWEREELPAPYPNGGLATLLNEPLEDLGLLQVGDFLYLLGCHVNGKARRVEIHAQTAKGNIVADIVAILGHHGPTGEATGGPLFAALADKIQTTRIKDGKLSAGKPAKADECVLVVHAKGRGVKTHMRLLEELTPGADGVIEFAPTDLSLAESNRAKAEAHRVAFFDGLFEKESDGVRFGLLTPKQTEGVNVYTPFVNKIVALGPQKDTTLTQARRTDRPLSKKEIQKLEGKRVRKDKTRMLHLDSPWATAVARMSNLGNAPNLLDAPNEVAERLKVLRAARHSEYDDKALVLITQMTMALVAVEGRTEGASQASALLPGALVDLFLTCVEDDEKCAAFMKRAPMRDDDEEEGETAKDGNYWSVVNKWKCDCSEEDEDANVTDAALWGEDDDE